MDVTLHTIPCSHVIILRQMDYDIVMIKFLIIISNGASYIYLAIVVQVELKVELNGNLASLKN